MNWYDYLIIYLSSCFIVFFVIKSCGVLLGVSNKKIIQNILIILVGGLLITYSLYKNDTVENIILSLVVLSLGGIILYKQNPYKIIFNIMICYLLVVLYEILLSIILLKITNFSLEVFNSNSIIKSVFSLTDVFLAYITCSNKNVKSFINKIVNKNFFLNTFLPVVIVCLLLLDAKYIFFTTKEVYIGNIVIISSLLYMLLFSIIMDYKLTKENEKTEILLNFMSKYEKIIDDDRLFKHEILNNLLILKSYKNKNSEEFNNLLDELIDSKSNQNVSIKNIYNLPSGLKGIFYYKLHNMIEDNYNISIHISKKLGGLLNKISHKDYINLYKIIGVILDNAIEACSNTKEKYLMIDVYKENNDVNIDILNSYSGKVKINDIYKKGYTTKGKKRGFGLYIVKNIIEKNDNIKISQSVDNNIFVTKVKVSL